MCNIGNLLLAIGLFLNHRELIRAAAIWMIPGLGIWFWYVWLSGSTGFSFHPRSRRRTDRRNLCDPPGKNGSHRLAVRLYLVSLYAGGFAPGDPAGAERESGTLHPAGMGEGVQQLLEILGGDDRPGRCRTVVDRAGVLVDLAAVSEPGTVATGSIGPSGSASDWALPQKYFVFVREAD